MVDPGDVPGSVIPEGVEMFDIVIEAGLLPHDVAAILSVNRVTASLWMNGHCEPHRLHKDKVERFIRAVQDAVDLGELPVSKDIPRQKRHIEVVRVLRRQYRLSK